MLITLIYELINNIIAKPNIIQNNSSLFNKRQQQTSMLQASKNLKNASVQNSIIKSNVLNQRKEKSHADLIAAKKRVSDLQQKYKISGPTVKF